MANENANEEQAVEEKGGGAIGWCFFPLALFPLVSLLTYDWRAMPQLATPPAPSSNWIGALGDAFAFWGYAIFGLAIWVVPVMCIVGGICLVAGLGPEDNRRRDGSYEYYISEPVVENDAKGVAPFLLAYTEILQAEA